MLGCRGFFFLRHIHIGGMNRRVRARHIEYIDRARCRFGFLDNDVFGCLHAIRNIGIGQRFKLLTLRRVHCHLHAIVTLSLVPAFGRLCAAAFGFGAYLYAAYALRELHLMRIRFKFHRDGDDLALAQIRDAGHRVGNVQSAVCCNLNIADRHAVAVGVNIG